MLYGADNGDENFLIVDPATGTPTVVASGVGDGDGYVDLAYNDWDEIQGVSMGALAEPVTDPEEMERVGKLMLDKFPQVAGLIPEDTEEIALYRVTPKVVSVLDYTKGFGHTDLVAL